MSAADCGRLLALITRLGLSHREAAVVCGLGHETLSRKLAGKDRYEVREEEIAALQALSDMVDASVEASIKAMQKQMKTAPAPLDEVDSMVPIRMVLYRSDKDLPASAAGYRFASVHRMAVSRILADPWIKKHSTGVPFDRESYETFLAGRRDTSAARAEWAALQPLSRFGLKLATGSIGWAVLKETPAKTAKVKRGVSNF